MMEWQDDGLVLGVRRHGENSAIVNLLTPKHGRHVGVVRGINGKVMRAALQPGNRVRAVWRARLEEHLGNYQIEPVASYSARFLHDGPRLLVVQSAATILYDILPEREPHHDIFDQFDALLVALETPQWLALYCQWELGLLQAVGFGLDLQVCAATGSNDDLAYVSPKSGRAVSRSAGEPYHDRLLQLPRFLLGLDQPDQQQCLQSLQLSGFFLERDLYSPLGRHFPEARYRLIQQLAHPIV